MLIPFEWIGPLAAVSIFTVMFSLGLLLGREQIEAALQRRVVLAAVIFAVLVPVPALAVLAVNVFSLRGPVAVGVILMAISPGAPVALRRALDAGGHREFAPALHLAIVLLAVVTVPGTVLVLDWIFAADFAVTPLHIARQVFFAQLLPIALGAMLRAWRPAVAARIEPGFAKAGTLLLLVVFVMALVNMPAIIGATGWIPPVAGVLMTLCALVLGSTFAGRDLAVRPAGALAAAMRNPGLAIVIATVNKASPVVTAAILGYTLGMALVVIAYLQWRKRRQ
jgi:BASS family bile acid:Na+ symporter